MWKQPVDGSPLKPKTRMSALGWRRLHHCERTPGSMLSRGWNKLVKLTSGKPPRGVCVCKGYLVVGGVRHELGRFRSLLVVHLGGVTGGVAV